MNVWIALTTDRHVHHAVARMWFQELDPERPLCFCRFTQLGFLRLLTTEAVMGEHEVLGQSEAWKVYDQWLADDRVLFLEEPLTLEPSFRSLSRHSQPAPKDWADSYLAAFASGASLHLVTFDQALRGKTKEVLVLKP